MSQWLPESPLALMHFNPKAFSAASALSLQNNNQRDVMHSLHNIITDTGYGV